MYISVQSTRQRSRRTEKREEDEEDYQNIRNISESCSREAMQLLGLYQRKNKGQDLQDKHRGGWHSPHLQTE